MARTPKTKDDEVVNTFTTLRAAGDSYEKVRFTDADGKHRTAKISGDAVSKALVGATRDDLVKVAKANKLGAEVVAKIESATNVGTVRMSLSNRLRAKVKHGTPVDVRGVVINDLDQTVEAPAPKKPRARKAA
jgi:hypothetical protein